MVTKTEQRAAGVTALVAGAALAASVALYAGGPGTTHGGGVLTWLTEHADQLKVGALMWLVAVMALVAFAVALREAMWATVLDRNWSSLLFVQGAVVFSTVSVVAAALAWALAEQAVSGAMGAELAGTTWAIEHTLLRFATWGMTAPLVLVGLVLYRHSTMGQVGAVAGAVVAVGMVLPWTWGPAMYAFSAWLIFAGVTVVRSPKVDAFHPEMAS